MTSGTTRRTGGADVELVPAPPAPSVDSWAPALLDALAPEIGGMVRFANGPDAPEHRSQGPWAYPFELASVHGELPEPWRGTLTVRLADHEAEVRREEAALRFCAAHGLGAPAALARVALGAAAPLDSALRATHALVTRMPDLVPLPELIMYNLKLSDELLAGFGRAHAALHECDTSGIGPDVPVLSIPDELERLDATRFATQLAWLRANLPAPSRVVLCHGSFQPLCVFGPPADDWDEVGGPGGGLVAANWCGAVLAPREYDVGLTVATFWMAPFFAPNRSERTAFKLIRNTLSNGYRLAYSSVTRFDADALRFWLAFHSLRGMARLADAYDYDGSIFAAPERGTLPTVLAPELDRLFKMQRRG